MLAPGWLAVAALALQAAPQAPSSSRVVKLRVMVGERPAPPETEVRLFAPSMLCGTGQRHGAPMHHPDANGEVTFEDVVPGSTVSAEHPALGTERLGGDALAAQLPIIRFPTGLPLAGRVVDDKGRPVLRARVAVIPETPDPDRGEQTRLERVSEVDGAFFFANLAPGKWAVTADAFDDVWPAALVVDAGTQNHAVRLPARVWFSGLVSDGMGRPVKAPWLHLRTVGATGDTLESRDPSRQGYQALLRPSAAMADPKNYRKSFGGDASGHFETFVPVSRPVEVWAEGPGGCGESQHEVVTPQRTTLDLRIPAYAAVTASVVGPGGAPLPGARLAFSGPSACEPRTVTGEGGRVAVDDLPAVFTSVRVSAPKMVWVDRQLRLRPGKKVDLGTIELVLGARLVGRVLSSDGTPAFNVTVSCGSNAVAWTDQEGRFEVEDLPPGPQLLRANRLGGGPLASQRLTLVSGEERSIELRLAPR